MPGKETRTMRAKMVVRSVAPTRDDSGQSTELDRLTFSAVTTSPFGADGESEDNTYAKWTPSAELSMTITNPNLLGKFAVGDTFYVDFTKVE